MPTRNSQNNLNICKKRFLLALALTFAPLFLCLSQAKEFPSPDRFVVFKSGTASSCGFFGKQGDKTYVFTSMHGLGNTGFNLSMKDGRQIKTGTVELASDRDIVRISTDEIPVSFFEIYSQLQMSQAVTIFTASSSDPKKAAYATDSRDAAVTGIGPEFFSLSKIDKSPYMLSGSPVLNGGGKVIGIIGCDIPFLERPDPKKPDLLMKVNWGDAVCSRFSDDIKWIAVNKQDLTFQLKILADSRSLVDDYVSVSCMWSPNPYGKIEISAPRVELKPWIEEHNRKMENSSKNMANTAKDPKHFQDLARQMQETAKEDGMRLSSFASSRTIATGNLGMTPYMKYYSSGMSVFLDEISKRISSRASTLAYVSPNALTKKK
ncbi:MAG: hypothetical protein WC637_14855 [Victivallales bacterium]